MIENNSVVRVISVNWRCDSSEANFKFIIVEKLVSLNRGPTEKLPERMFSYDQETGLGGSKKIRRIISRTRDRIRHRDSVLANLKP